MKEANDIQDELISWGNPLAGMSREMPYEVPDMYFAHLPETMRHIVEMEDETDAAIEPFLKSFGNKNVPIPYILPQDYFGQLPAQVMAEIKNNELAGKLPKPLLYAVPEGYFNTLPAQALAIAKDSGQEAVAESSSSELEQQAGAEEGSSRVIPLKKKSVWWHVRWAAAAALLIGIGIGSYRPLFVKQPFDTEKALSKVPQSEINEYVQQNIDDFDVELLVSNLPASSANTIQPQQLNNKEIIDYLNENGWQDAD